MELDKIYDTSKIFATTSKQNRPWMTIFRRFQFSDALLRTCSKAIAITVVRLSPKAPVFRSAASIAEALQKLEHGSCCGHFLSRSAAAVKKAEHCSIRLLKINLETGTFLIIKCSVEYACGH